MRKCVMAVLSVVAAFFCVMSVYAEDFGTEYGITLLNCRGFPEYHSVAEENMSLCGDIAEELECRKEQIDVQTDLSAEELSLVFEAAVNENPLIDYVRDVVYILETDGGYTIRPVYDEAAVSLMDNSYNAELEKILSCVDSTMSDADKCFAVHNYMVTHYQYDLSYSNYTMRKLLTTGRGVCQAYADTYTYIMGELGITCVTISSDAMNHAWNMVKLDGEWYHVDVTWDDPVEDEYGTASQYMYFLLSDDAMSDETHMHYGWSTSRTADSTKYESCFWVDLLDEATYYYYYQNGFEMCEYYYQCGCAMYYQNGYWYYHSYDTVYRGKITASTASKYKSVYVGECPEYTAVYGDYAYGLSYCNDSYVLVRANIISGDWEIIYTFNNYDDDTAYRFMLGFLVDEDGVTVYDPTNDFIDEYFDIERDYDDKISTEYYTLKDNYIYTVDVTEAITKPEMSVTVSEGDCTTSITASAPSGYTVYYAYVPFDSDIDNSTMFYYEDDASEYTDTVTIDYPGMYKVSFFGVKSDGNYTVYTAVEDVVVTHTYSGAVGTIDESNLSAMIKNNDGTKVLNGTITLNIDSELANVFVNKAYSNGAIAISYQCFIAVYSGSEFVDVIEANMVTSIKAYFKADNIVLPSDDCTIKVFLWQTDSDGAQTAFPISQAAVIEV